MAIQAALVVLQGYSAKGRLPLWATVQRDTCLRVTTTTPGKMLRSQPSLPLVGTLSPVHVLYRIILQNTVHS